MRLRDFNGSGVRIGNEGISPLDSLADFNRAIIERERQEQDPVYQQRLATAAEIVYEGMHGGRRGLQAFQEALSTAEFPTYFGDVLDRMVLARFTEWVPPFERYLKVGTFSDLTRDKRMTQFGGGNETLDRVGEFGPYPKRGTQPTHYTWKGEKYGADFGISWETMLADDLNGLRDLPGVLASASRSSEAKFATELHVDANGPHASLYTVQNGNVGTAPLSIDALKAGVTAMSQFVDPVSGVPIFNRPRFLVVPPALEITALEIVRSQQMTYAATAQSAVPLVTRNVTSELGLEVIVNPWIPIVASSSNGDTSWFLFSEPNASPLGPGLAAAQFDRLRGMSNPLLLQEIGRFAAVGGGPDPRGALNDVDAANFRVVHAMGGGQLFPQATYGSSGAGS